MSGGGDPGSDPGATLRIAIDLPEDVKTAALDPARCLGRYVLVSELGRGGMGRVYRAWDTSSGRMVALKTLLDTSGDPAFLARFQREASTAARLHHPGIVAILEVGAHQGRPFIVMELVDGESLEALLRREKPAPRRAAEIAREVAAALQHAHENGVVHRDVKPENVLVDRAGKTHLMDFGLAFDTGDTERFTATGMVLGTPAYMAPEQADGDRAAQGPLTDVYALGAVLYRALAGRAVFAGESFPRLMKKIVFEEPTPLVEAAPGVPEALARITHRCLAKKPADRFPTAGAVAEELGRFLDAKPAEARPSSPTRPSAPAPRPSSPAKAVVPVKAVVTTQPLPAPSRRWKALVGGAVVLLAALAALAVAAGAKVRRDRADAVLVVQQAQAHLKHRELDKALADATRAVELDPKSAPAWTTLGTAHRMNNEPEKAAPAYAKALALDPHYVHALFGRACLEEATDRDAAIKAMRELLDNDKAGHLAPEEHAYFAGVLARRADARVQKRSFKEAIEDANEALKLDASKPLAYFARAAAEQALKQDPEALADLNATIEHDASFAEAYVHRAEIHNHAKEWDASIRDATKAIELKPDSPVVYRVRAIAHENRKEYALAIADYEKFIALGPKDPGNVDPVKKTLERLRAAR